MFSDPQVAQTFLTRHWQRKHLFLAAALPRSLPVLDEHELAWLATQPDVESRLIVTERSSQRAIYRVEHGPFDAERLGQLPPEDWTLLVQDVDKHLPDFRAYLEQPDVIPEWRVDDLMVSFAMPGGSVGPHRDNYDVFLCQGSGTRRWRISDQDIDADDSATELSLLHPFVATESFLAREGDVLYLPPETAHWGVAESPCMTYSIGMRAPTGAEIALGIDRVLNGKKEGASGARSPDRFYTDQDLEAGEADGGRISAQSLLRLRQQGLVDDALSDDQLALAFGSVVTDPKAWLAPDELSPAEAQRALQSSEALQIHGMARIAWYESASVNYAFANGMGRQIQAADIALLRALHAERRLSTVQRRHLRGGKQVEELTLWLLQKGVFDVLTDDE